MKANKVTLVVTVECLHKDGLGGLLSDVMMHLEAEDEAGTLVKEDGDSVSWETKTTPVEF